LKKHSDDHVNTNQEVKSLLARSGLCLWNFTCPMNELLAPGFGQVGYVEDCMYIIEKNASC